MEGDVMKRRSSSSGPRTLNAIDRKKGRIFSVLARWLGSLGEGQEINMDDQTSFQKNKIA